MTITLYKFDADVIGKLLGSPCIRMLEGPIDIRIYDGKNIPIIIRANCSVQMVKFFVDHGYKFKPNGYGKGADCWEYWFIRRPEVATEGQN